MSEDKLEKLIREQLLSERHNLDKNEFWNTLSQDIPQKPKRVFPFFWVLSSLVLLIFISSLVYKKYKNPSILATETKINTSVQSSTSEAKNLENQKTSESTVSELSDLKSFLNEGESENINKKSKGINDIHNLKKSTETTSKSIEFESDIPYENTIQKSDHTLQKSSESNETVIQNPNIDFNSSNHVNEKRNEAFVDALNSCKYLLEHYREHQDLSISSSITNTNKNEISNPWSIQLTNSILYHSSVLQSQQEELFTFIDAKKSQEDSRFGLSNSLSLHYQLKNGIGFGIGFERMQLNERFTNSALIDESQEEVMSDTALVRIVNGVRSYQSGISTQTTRRYEDTQITNHHIFYNLPLSIVYTKNWKKFGFNVGLSYALNLDYRFSGKALITDLTLSDSSIYRRKINGFWGGNLSLSYKLTDHIALDFIARYNQQSGNLWKDETIQYKNEIIGLGTGITYKF